MPITSDTKQLLQALNRLKQRRLNIVGTIATTFFKRDIFNAKGFIDQGIKKWQDRATNDTGKKGKKSKSRALLIYTGNLRRSIRILHISTNSVSVGSKGVKYAEIHNTGGTITQTPTDKQRRFFWAMHKQTNNDNWKYAALAQTIHIRIPQRQFIGTSAALDKRIQRQFIALLKQLFENNR